MSGTVPTADFFVDDTLGGQGSHYQFPRTAVDQMLSSASKMVASGGAGRRRLPPMDRWLLAGLDAHPLEPGSSAVVFGSMQPWYEAIALAAGAGHVTTIEYNRLTYEHPNITTTTPAALQPPAGGFDVGFSISSFDHDGLGRYGDPVEPDGDLLAMRAARCLLKPGGLLFLTVPIGPDVVVWNLHRRYGKMRLPHMLHGWDVVEAVGWDPDRLTADANFRRSYEPLLVLRRTGTGEEDLTPSHTGRAEL